VTRQRLTRDDWAAAALAALGEGGVKAVAVEPLAARLGTTKGSFYWHFPNRDALLRSALELWEERDTNAVHAEVEAASDDPTVRLRVLIGRVARRDRVLVALLAAADGRTVASVLKRVNEQRIGFLQELLAEAGLEAGEARRRAVLAYSAYLGHAQLLHATPEVLPHGRAYLDHVVRTLTR
jgi:AcrR family transcriptional regulator